MCVSIIVIRIAENMISLANKRDDRVREGRLVCAANRSIADFARRSSRVLIQLYVQTTKDFFAFGSRRKNPSRGIQSRGDTHSILIS